MSAALVLSILRNSWRKSGCFMWNSSKMLQPGGRALCLCCSADEMAYSQMWSHPICRHGCQIIHYTPGKRWDSLYTWDSGMIGIGMLEYSTQKAEYVLDTYSVRKKTTRILPFCSTDLWCPLIILSVLRTATEAAARGQSLAQAVLSHARRYYQFSLEKRGVYNRPVYKAACLLCVRLRYNASGMDDYPAQVELHKQKLSILWLPLQQACIWCASQNS